MEHITKDYNGTENRLEISSGIVEITECGDKGFIAVAIANVVTEEIVAGVIMRPWQTAKWAAKTLYLACYALVFRG